MEDNARIGELLGHFREAFAKDPPAAYRDWFRAQEELRDANDANLSKALADDLWAFAGGLRFVDQQARARFLHNLGVFFGSPGPAADLPRCRAAFATALEFFVSSGDDGWQARALHNFATSLSNLGSTAAELRESLALFEKALEWRTSEREIARGVTLHNSGLALRRLSELDPQVERPSLEASARAFEEAVDIRERHGLAEGRARSLFHRGVTLLRLAREDVAANEEARRILEAAAEEFERLGKTDSAETARELARSS